ncbi:MAG: nitroreductase family protein [Alphaproteobacteria bacterium]
MSLYAGQKSEHVLDYLLHRRSVLAANMQEPGPSRDELIDILTAAARVPDHGKLSPFYFLVFQGEQRAVIGKKLRELYPNENPKATSVHLDNEECRFLRAPVVVAVVSRIRNAKVPMWEQILCAGAACMNLVTAANASGYAAQWLSEWYAFDPDFKAYLGLDNRDNIAGFIYLGRPVSDPAERPRPDIEQFTTYWEEGQEINKGDIYAANKFGVPKTGFDLSKVK